MSAKKIKVSAQKLIHLLSIAADAEQLRLHPLPAHAIAEEEEHLRRHYALILAALLSTQEQVSETQSRLLVLLLNSLALGDIRAELFDTARRLEPDTLLEAARLIREANCREELFVDALILLRLDALLNADTVKLVGELASFLGLDAEQVELRANHAASILGLGEDSNVNILQHWPQFIPYELTVDDLREGINGGLWLVNKKLEVNIPWQACDAVFIFEPEAKIYTDGHTGITKLNNCNFHLAQLVFTGVGEVQMENCIWHGNYIEASEAFSSSGLSVHVQNCEFTTLNATALIIKEENLSVINSRFIQCGSESKITGAIYHKNKSENIKQIITSCYFHACTGKSSGAILAYYLKKIDSCEFIDCSSTGLKKIRNLAIYTKNKIEGDPVISNSAFQNSSLSIGSISINYFSTAWRSRIFLIKNCQFNKSNIYYHGQKISNNEISSDCIFIESNVIKNN